MQNLLVSGRKKEALQCAQEGQLWGPALVLASQLGEQVCFFFIKLSVTYSYFRVEEGLTAAAISLFYHWFLAVTLGHCSSTLILLSKWHFISW